jgi:uncharacterized protein YjbJ (UPF0337 family)
VPSSIAGPAGDAHRDAIGRMGALDKAAARLEELKSKAKEAVAEATDNRDRQAEGAADQVSGKTRQVGEDPARRSTTFAADHSGAPPRSAYPRPISIEVRLCCVGQREARRTTGSLDRSDSDTAGPTHASSHGVPAWRSASVVHRGASWLAAASLREPRMTNRVGSTLSCQGRPGSASRFHSRSIASVPRS